MGGFGGGTGRAETDLATQRCERCRTAIDRGKLQQRVASVGVGFQGYYVCQRLRTGDRFASVVPGGDPRPLALWGEVVSLVTGKQLGRFRANVS
jgi:hypothetical protein